MNYQNLFRLISAPIDWERRRKTIDEMTSQFLCSPGNNDEWQLRILATKLYDKGYAKP